MFRKQLAKKCCAVLTAVCLAAAAQMPAWAANGPNESEGSGAWIRLVTPKGEDNSDADILNPYSYADGVKDVGNGVSYDKATNTLTLTNYNNPATSLVTNEMGDDLKLVLVGENHLSCIVVWGFGYGGSIEISGNGSLILNENKGEIPFRMQAEGTKGILKIDADVTLEAYRAENQDIITINSCTTKENPVQILGNLETPLKPAEGSGEEITYQKQIKFSHESSESYDEYTFTCAKRDGDDRLYGLWYNDYSDNWRIYQLVKADKLPSGNSYIACTVTDTNTGEWPEEYVKTNETAKAFVEADYSGSYGYEVTETATGKVYLWAADEIVYPEGGGQGTAYYSLFEPQEGTYSRRQIFNWIIGDGDQTRTEERIEDCSVAVPVEQYRNVTSDAAAIPEGFEAKMTPSGTYWHAYSNDVIKITPSGSHTLAGDADGDGSITLTDAQTVLKVALKIEQAPEGAVLDVNGDGNVDLSDAQVVLQKALKIIP